MTLTFEQHVRTAVVVGFIVDLTRNGKEEVSMAKNSDSSSTPEEQTKRHETPKTFSKKDPGPPADNSGTTKGGKK